MFYIKKIIRYVFQPILKNDHSLLVNIELILRSIIIQHDAFSHVKIVALIRHLHISHNAPYLPPKFCKTFVFHFPWVLQPSQEKLKTMLMRKFGGLIRCIMGDVQVANEEDENDDVSKDSLTD